MTSRTSPPTDGLERPARSLRHQLATPVVAGVRCSPLLAGIAFLVGPTIAGGALVALIAVIALAWRRRVPADPPGDREPAGEPDATESAPAVDDHSSV